MLQNKKHANRTTNFLLSTIGINNCPIKYLSALSHMFDPYRNLTTTLKVHPAVNKMSVQSLLCAVRIYIKIFASYTH